LVGKPTLFIPSPNVAEDHQTKNANAIVDKEGALLIKENELDTQFATTINSLLNDENLQKKLSENMLQLAKPNATIDIVDEIVKLIKK
jgi:UDP-N-acetylglucosamine--N-acetylmuramyl-(pentapeptide) pyrophosphoryl-undecaprenol N-acetylglucosamine transferase